MGKRVEIAVDGLPKTKAEAIACDSRYFYTATPCANGHDSPRIAFPNRSICVECTRVNARRSTVKYYAKNSERCRAIARADQAKKRACGTDWGFTHKDAHAAMKAQWKRENLDRGRADAMRRKAAKLNAQPKWLTQAHKTEIAAFYKAAAAASVEIKHEVDHIVPLQGRTVSGLHVPWNMRVIPATANNRRPRIWNPMESE